MKFKNHLIVVAMLGGFFLTANATFAQGSLTPPGAPAPTMKTADQIEPRTIVNAANTPGDAQNSFIIKQPGSYYLTTNLVGVSGKGGIEILTNNVTLDLNGFVLQGALSSGSGIYSFNTGCTNLTIRNGSINNWGGSGVAIFTAINCLLEGLNVSSNGGHGITVGGYGVIRNCNSSLNAGDGFNCDVASGNYVITSCTAQNNTLRGFIIFGIVSDCNAQNNGAGIYLELNSTAANCRVVGNHGDGIIVGPKCRVTGNVVTGNTTAGDLSAAGIHLIGSNSRIEDNHLAANAARGIWTDGSFSGAQNIIIKNSVIGSGANNYSVGGSDIFGPILNNPSSGITNSSPWGNFSL